MGYTITDEQVAAALGGAKPAAGGGWYCRCPTHDDGKASLWIKQMPGGGLAVKCHAGCASDNVKAELSKRRLWPQPGARAVPVSDVERRHRKGPEILEVVQPVPADAPKLDWSNMRGPAPHHLYEYMNSAGVLVGYVARWNDLAGEKKILPVSLARLADGSLRWAIKAPKPPHTLYNLDDLARRPNAPVMMVEGEKAAEAASKQFPDHVVMTWRMGAGAAKQSDFSPLHARDVLLWPDADDAGVNAMAEVATVLGGVGATARLVQLPPGLPKGWDLADPVPDGVSITDILGSAGPAALTYASKESATVTEAANAAHDRANLLPFVVTAAQLQAEEADQREPIVDPFLLTSSLNMLFAPRGVGKTFLSLAIGISVAEGIPFLSYEVASPRRVLFVDGEMPLSDLKMRVGMMAPNPPDNFAIIPSERLFRDGVPINLHSGEDQDRIFALLDDLGIQNRRPDLIIFDNLSSLSGGVNENDNSELDNLLRFLMALRHRGYAILLVHHAGKGGDQRGASRREDLLDTVMALYRPDEVDAPREGAHAILKFTKVRGRRPVPDELEIWLMENEGQLEWAFQRPKSKNPAMAALRAIFEQKLEQQKDLCSLLDVTAGRVSQIMKQLRQADLVDVHELVLTTAGRERLVAEFPELYEIVAKQGRLSWDEGPI